ncbi:MAG TPA: hypothetical protein VFT43_03145, partial [Candidatus Polarisedimenticolia bacterium]|nr:hypothetical protein [Candidatus Polarisedimenticolia bacterium]
MNAGMILLLVVATDGCGSGRGAAAPGGALVGRAVGAIDRTTGEMRHAFEEKARKARNDLEAAREAAEKIVAGRAAESRAAAALARER